MEDDTNENNYIRTRAHLYTLEQEQMNQHKEKKPTSGAKNTRNKHILNCRKHYKQKPEPQPQCNDCIRYQYVNQLPHGYLPSCKTVLEYLLTSKSEQTGKRINHERAVGADLAMLWISCNVYPRPLDNAITAMIGKMFEEFKFFKKSAGKPKQSDAYWQRFAAFSDQQRKLFDIICK